MGRLPFTKDLPDPGNTKGVAGVGSSTPIPRRAQPLPGTKKMKCPADHHCFTLEGLQPQPAVNLSRGGAAFGWAAMAGSLVLIAMFWAAPWLSQPDDAFRRFLGAYGTAVVILLLGFTHVLVVFSQIVSEGEDSIGRLALFVLWAGLPLSMVVGHFI